MPATTKFWGAPGTGKTTRLLHEITTLIECHGHSKSDFVVTTFRRQMANELKTRLTWDKGEGMINTIHGVCKSLAGINAVIEPKDKAAFCESVKMPYAIEAENRNDHEPSIKNGSSKLGNLFFDCLSFLVNNMYNDFFRVYRFSDVDKIGAIVPDPEAFMEDMAKKYRTWKAEHGLYDFDDMLSMVHDQRLIPDASVLVVDEFQDLTTLQYKIICMWAEHMDKVMIAGDPRQTLYGFWGANAKFFEEHEGEQVILPVSYRLPACIWSYAKNILERASLTAPDIDTPKKAGVLKTVSVQAYYERLPNFKTSTFHLVRINEMGRSIARSLADAGIPFTGISGWGKKQILIYNAIIKIRKNLAGIETPITADELSAIVEIYPAKYFSKKKKEIRSKLTDVKLSIRFEHIEGLASTDMQGRRALWQDIKCDTVLENCLGTLKDKDDLGRIKILAALQKHREQITTVEVYVYTVHAAKGAEADYVFLHDSITRKIHKKLYTDFSEDAIQAEAQVFYVGATRARQALFIVQSGDTYSYALPDTEAAQ